MIVHLAAHCRCVPVTSNAKAHDSRRRNLVDPRVPAVRLAAQRFRLCEAHPYRPLVLLGVHGASSSQAGRCSGV
jgi:hypothetical protein